jgi:hypothetical protein
MNLRDVYNFVGPDADKQVVYVPFVDQQGNLSWSNNGGLENPATVNIGGKSAYQTWLSLGNTGSEADFINSLMGEDGSKGGHLVWLSAADADADGYNWDYPITKLSIYSLILKRPVSVHNLFIEMEGSLSADFSGNVIVLDSTVQADRANVKVFNGVSWIDHPSDGIGTDFDDKPAKILLTKFTDFGEAYFIRYRWNSPTNGITGDWTSIAIPSYNGVTN